MTFNLRLDSGYYITTDKYQYILKRKVRNQDICEGYFSSLNSLFCYYFGSLVRRSNVNSIKSLMKEQHRIIKRMEVILKPLNLRIKVV